MSYKEWFQKNGNVTLHVGEQITVEELYQNFEERLLNKGVEGGTNWNRREQPDFDDCEKLQEETENQIFKATKNHGW